MGEKAGAVVKRLALGLVFAALASGCTNDRGAAELVERVEPACTPEGLCSACATCFDSCLCGGGAAARCASQCAEDPPEGGAGGDAGESTLPGSLVATIATDAFDIGPGEEVFRCQNFSNPFGRDVAVLSTDSFVTAGSHHMFVFQAAGIEDGPIEVCGGLEFGSYLHLSQRSQERFTYPEGVGRYFAASEGVRVQIHYFNASDDAVRTEMAVTIRAEPPEEVPVLASQIFMNTFGISVPPHSKGVAEHGCGIPEDVNLLTAMSHMHSHGVAFQARTSEGQLLFETTQWAEPPPWYFDPPRKLRGGSRIEVRCGYDNRTSSTLTFGESADTSEMCIFVGTYYPAALGESIVCLF